MTVPFSVVLPLALQQQNWYPPTAIQSASGWGSLLLLGKISHSLYD